MRRPGYKDALQWLIDNEDLEFLDNGDPISISTSMTAHLFGRTDEEVITDLKKQQAYVERMKRVHEFLNKIS